MKPPQKRPLIHDHFLPLEEHYRVDWRKVALLAFLLVAFLAGVILVVLGR